jgi:hypothetical protein
MLTLKTLIWLKPNALTMGKLELLINQLNKFVINGTDIHGGVRAFVAKKQMD